jgi:hypothetical protein
MPALLCALAAAVRAVFCPRADLVLENLALRQQLAILVRRRPRPRLSVLDRALHAAVEEASFTDLAHLPAEPHELRRRH